MVSIERALFYLQTRLTMIDYAHFRHCGYPIGSGAVESGHKVVATRLWCSGVSSKRVCAGPNIMWTRCWRCVTCFAINVGKKAGNKSYSTSNNSVRTNACGPARKNSHQHQSLLPLLLSKLPDSCHKTRHLPNGPRKIPVPDGRPKTIPGATIFGRPKSHGAGISLFNESDGHPSVSERLTKCRFFYKLYETITAHILHLKLMLLNNFNFGQFLPRNVEFCDLSAIYLRLFRHISSCHVNSTQIPIRFI